MKLTLELTRKELENGLRLSQTEAKAALRSRMEEVFGIKLHPLPINPVLVLLGKEQTLVDTEFKGGHLKVLVTRKGLRLEVFNDLVVAQEEIHNLVLAWYNNPKQTERKMIVKTRKFLDPAEVDTFSNNLVRFSTTINDLRNRLWKKK